MSSKLMIRLAGAVAALTLGAAGFTGTALAGAVNNVDGPNGPNGTASGGPGGKACSATGQTGPMSASGLMGALSNGGAPAGCATG